MKGRAISRVGAAALCALSACARAPDETPEAASGDMPDITLEESAPGEWRVEYQTAKPVSELRFARNPNDSRPERWRAGAGFEFAHENGGEFLRRADGASFARASAVATARYTPLPKDYAVFSPFTDGGLLMHSGQFFACPSKAECPDSAEWRVTIAPPKGAHLIVRGAIHDGAVTFSDTGDGTNIYIGDKATLDSSHFIAVIDEGLPNVLRQALYDLFPPLMDYFTERLGALPRKPMLFASIDPNSPAGSGFSAQGGTLPDQVFIHLYGENWRTRADERRADQLPFFFAHEAGHLFQRIARNHSNFNMEQSWIHEGGADAFAVLAISQFAGVDPALNDQRVRKAAGDCVAGMAALEGKPLNASGEADAFDNYYNCGLVINLAMDAEVKANSDGARDLFDLWALFMARVIGGAPWDQETFVEAAKDSGAPEAAAFAIALAASPQATPEDFVRGFLQTTNAPALAAAGAGAE